MQLICNLTLGLRGGGASTQTRALFGGGMTSPNDTRVNIIDYVTIASQGEALNFGDMTTSKVFGACSSNLMVD